METSMIRSLRKARGMTIRQACQQINIADPVLSAVERRSRVAWPRLRQALSTMLDTDSDVLFETTGLAARVNNVLSWRDLDPQTQELFVALLQERLDRARVSASHDDQPTITKGTPNEVETKPS